MAIRYRIQCINKKDRNNVHEKIVNIGGINYDGTKWKITQEEAIKGIETGKWQFYVNVNNREVDVIISVSSLGHKYLKTETDNYEPNNLLSLPECN